MTKEKSLVEFIVEQAARPRHFKSSRMAFHLAREFANHPDADPEDYSEELKVLCNKLNVDLEEMSILISAKIKSVKHPFGRRYEDVVKKALTQPKRFRIPFKGKRNTMINIFYYLSEANNHGLFNIPAKRVATSSHTSAEVVYAFIIRLIDENFLKLECEADLSKRKGRLFRWLEQPVS